MIKTSRLSKVLICLLSSSSLFLACSEEIKTVEGLSLKNVLAEKKYAFQDNVVLKNASGKKFSAFKMQDFHNKGTLKNFSENGIVMLELNNDILSTLISSVNTWYVVHQSHNNLVLSGRHLDGGKLLYLTEGKDAQVTDGMYFTKGIELDKRLLYMDFEDYEKTNIVDLEKGSLEQIRLDPFSDAIRVSYSDAEKNKGTFLAHSDSLRKKEGIHLELINNSFVGVTSKTLLPTDPVNSKLHYLRNGDIGDIACSSGDHLFFSYTENSKSDGKDFDVKTNKVVELDLNTLDIIETVIERKAKFSSDYSSFNVVCSPGYVAVIQDKNKIFIFDDSTKKLLWKKQVERFVSLDGTRAKTDKAKFLLDSGNSLWFSTSKAIHSLDKNGFKETIYPFLSELSSDMQTAVWDLSQDKTQLLSCPLSGFRSPYCYLIQTGLHDEDIVQKE